MAEVVVEFDRSTQTLGALREAAYRIIGQASCQIDSTDTAFRCRLMPKDVSTGMPGETELRSKFLDLVTDENLREKVAAETAPVRDVILALAFGSLAGDGAENNG